MLISRKKDKGFYNIIIYTITKYLQTQYIGFFSGDTSCFTRCIYSSDNQYIFLDVPITYMYEYEYLDGRVYTFGVQSTSHVSLSLTPVSISHDNILSFGISLENPTYTIDTASIIDQVWDNLASAFKGVDKIPFTYSYLTNQIENQFNEIGNKSVSLKNTTKYSRIPKWVDTSKFIPLVFWNTDSYRIRFARCSDPVRLSKWFSPEDHGISMLETFVNSMVYELYIKFLFHSKFFYSI